MGDVNVLDIMPIEAGAFYVMDRGYLDYARLYGVHQTGAFFVTRAKRGMDAGESIRVAGRPAMASFVISGSLERLLLVEGLPRVSSTHSVQ